MERDFGSSMSVDEAFLRGYFSELISLQPLLQSPPLPYYHPYDAAPTINYPSPFNGAVSGSQLQMNFPSPYGAVSSASQFQYATPPTNYYQSPYDGGASSSQFQYVPPTNYFSPYDAGASNSSSVFQLPTLADPYGYFEQAPVKIPKNESFDSQEFAFQLLNLNGGGVSPEPLINFFSNNSAGGKYKKIEEAKPTMRYKPYSMRPPSEVARERRTRINDKTQRLKQLLPWDEKMDTGTMLEETYKYVKFLEAQVSVLRAMPAAAAPLNPSTGAAVFSRDGKSRAMEEELRRLDRQQLLQVVVNSPAVQTMLYSRGFCVYSGEQLAHVLRDLADKKAFLEQMMLSSPFRFHH